MTRIDLKQALLILLFSLFLTATASEYIVSHDISIEQGNRDFNFGKVPEHLPERSGDLVQRHVQVCFRSEGKKETKECVDLEFPLMG